MSSPSPIPNDMDYALETPRVNFGTRTLLSPPPAPHACVYEEVDILTCSTEDRTEQRQVSSSRDSDFVINTPLLTFPTIHRSTENNGNNNSDNDNNNNGSNTINTSNSNRPRRRRANSFDTAPFPRITLRPRFNMDFLRQHRNTYNDNPLEWDEGGVSSIDNVSSNEGDRHQTGCICMSCRLSQLVLPININAISHDISGNDDDLMPPSQHQPQHRRRNQVRPTQQRSHMRAHTFDGQSSVFMTGLSEDLPPPISHRRNNQVEDASRATALPSIPSFQSMSSSLNLSSMGRDLPPSSPPKSSFFNRAGTDLADNDDVEIARPIPRHHIANISPLIGEKNTAAALSSRFCATSCEGTATCTCTGTLSSSNNSAFGTPIKGGKNTSSPMTSLSDCGSNHKSEVMLADGGQNFNQGMPYFPNYETDSIVSQHDTKDEEAMSSSRPLEEVHLLRSNQNDSDHGNVSPRSSSPPTAEDKSP